MLLSSEIFVLAIFIIGGPFFYCILRDSCLPGCKFFMWAYLLLTLSNIFTVVEEFWLNSFFNTCEHSSIAIASILLLVAVIKQTAKNKPENISRASDDSLG